MRFIIKDKSNINFSTIGTVDLRDGVMPSDIIRLAQSGFLHMQCEMSDAEKKLIDDGLKAEEERIHADAIETAKVYAKEIKLPVGEFDLVDLNGKQLKALCEERGLATNGNKFDLIDRLESAGYVPVVQAEKPKKAKK